MSNKSIDIKTFNIQSNTDYVLVIGNEYTGIPEEILFHSEHLHIPMPGIGYCLNSAMAASIGCYIFSETLRTTGEQNNGIQGDPFSQESF
jgi:tRNA G18 (ribose-2'-O)-methylase SpoU